MAVGDQMISTAPIPDVQMVNSRRATVTAVNEAWQMIDLRGRTAGYDRESGVTSWTAFPSAMPPPLTLRRARRSTPDMCWPTGAAANWRMSPCPGPESRPTSTSQRTRLPWPSRTSRLEWLQERRPGWAIHTGLPATADAQQHE